MDIETPVWPTYSFRAMGSQISFWLEADAASARTAFAQAKALFASNERILSRFDATSELAALNGHGAQWFQASSLLWDVVNQALALAACTGGLFDPTLLTALETAGYTHSFAQMQADDARGGPATSDAPSSRPSALWRPTAWADIVLNQARSAIKLPAGVRLDLGGIGKGYTAHQAVQLLSQWGPCLVDAGGDIVAGAAPQGLPGWPVAVAAPSPAQYAAQKAEDAPDLGDSSGDLFQLWLMEATLATSGIDYRRWQQAGRWRHHIIDPRTGQPAVTDLLTATVWHSSAIYAEGWAKAALLLGATAGLERLGQEKVAAVLAGQDGQIYITPAMAELRARGLGAGD